MAYDGAGNGRVEDVGGIMVEEVVSPVGRIRFGFVCGGIGMECEFVPVSYHIYINFAFFEREMSTR